MSIIRKLGKVSLQQVKRMGVMGLFFIKTFIYTAIPPLKFSRILKQIRFIGFQSTLVILLTGSFAGMVLGFQGYYTLTRFGSDAFLGPMVGLALIKELGPVIAALMVTGRAGSAITAEIGIMRISEQISALELMGLNPYRYLIVPNFIAAIISLPLLTAVFDIVGIFGGYLIGVKLLGVGSGVYMGEMANYVEMQDILEGLYKSLSFGVIISWVCCFKGYYAGVFTGFGAEGVSKATTQAVVLSSVLILVWDYFMTSLLF
ncbi:MAG TPA: MlaE family lipid ABC transporter permease subunit [Desulfobacteraceae bacterium]|jgi:phospholipid/cholesterol/gamma-HCH transport system permease protein|nr:MlaE family lipid ABC transporter permease subunit [Desulfobacteraceae bacterium]HPJ67342.1 MlaE family lipid ABC transporter permease subunit [Desulfobacteraceae bacterium]HPQ28177.1 MlaE family lipid ABC transporter permease subunit [Desulfobacteraceae bacterium]